MNRGILYISLSGLLATAAYGASVGRKAELSRVSSAQAPVAAVPSLAGWSWESRAKLHRVMRAVPGDLVIDGTGIDFRSKDKEFSQRWSYGEIQTLDLWPRFVELRTYEKRGLFRPGLRRFRFDLESELPPDVAARAAQRMGKPVRNGNPEPKAPAFATLPALHLTAFGGSKGNGVLRFRAEGIDYVSEVPEDSRSWRWADLQTLSNLDPYHFAVFGYRETYSFDLKQPMSRDLFDRLTDEVYAHNPDFVSSAQSAKP